MAHYNLGTALKDKGRLDEAIAAPRGHPPQAGLRRRPLQPRRRPDSKGQLDEAIAGYREAIRLEPDYAEAHYNLGIALQDKGQLDEAIAAYREAIRLKPDSAEAHYNLGNALRTREAGRGHRLLSRGHPPRPGDAGP